MDEANAVRIAAVQALRDHRGRDALSALLRASALPSTAIPGVRLSAFRILALLGGRKAVDAVRSLRYDLDRSVRDAVQGALEAGAPKGECRMSDRLRKLKDEASELLRKGRYEKSLALFKEALAIEPGDQTVRRNVGNLLRKLGRKDEAVQVFIGLANEYAERSFMLKAIAMCKVVLEIDPNHRDVQARLAELYAGQADNTPKPLQVLAEADPAPPSPPEAALAAATLQGIDLPANDEAFQIERTTGAARVAQAPQMMELEVIELQPIPLGVNAVPAESLPIAPEQKRDFSLSSAAVQPEPAVPAEPLPVAPEREQDLPEAPEDQEPIGIERTATPAACQSDGGWPPQATHAQKDVGIQEDVDIEV